MIAWFAFALVAVGVIGALVSVGVYARKSGPNDYSLGAAALLGVLLVVQMLISIVAPFVGNAPVGDPLEFWMYLITALALPFAVGFWALIDRKRTANLVLCVMHVSVVVMILRMLVIWE